MKSYFAKQNWYKPQFENVSDQLWELEKLTVRLIQRYDVKAQQVEEKQKRNKN